jgi:hypothetical protein
MEPILTAPTHSKPKKARRSSRGDARNASASTAPHPDAPAAGVGERHAFVSSEVPRDLQDRVDREVRALLRDYPYAVLGGVFGAGLLLAGGWSGRVGRLAVFAAERYFAAMATEGFGGR